MKTTAQVSKIILIIGSNFNAKVIELLSSCGILSFYSSVGRQNYLRETTKFPNVFASGFAVSSHRSDIFRFYVPHDCEKRVLNYLSEKLDLKTTGNGSVFAEKVEIIMKNNRLYDEELLKKLPVAEESNSLAYHFVTAIVQRGTADAVSKNLLEMGYGVPTVCFGEGMGLRQKLGLLRIVIPTDKEILMILVPPSNSASAVEVIKKTAQLETPGKGVIFVEKVQAMNVNIRIYLDTQRHAATMDQIITSIDIMHGSTEWRARAKSGRLFAGEEKLRNILLIAEDDNLEKSVQAALTAGVNGATSIDYNEHFFNEEDNKLLSFQTTKGCEMVFKEKDRNRILGVIEESGFFQNQEIVEITAINYFFVSKK